MGCRFVFITVLRNRIPLPVGFQDLLQGPCASLKGGLYEGCWYISACAIYQEGTYLKVLDLQSKILFIQRHHWLFAFQCHGYHIFYLPST